MLKPAQSYEADIRSKFIEASYDMKYKYYFCGYHDVYSSKSNTYWYHEFASVDSNDNVLGYLAYSVDRYANVAYNIRIIGFSNSNPFIFGADIMQWFKDIFEKYHFRLMKFDAVCGSPVEPLYDKLIKKYGGRIIGISYGCERLSDGSICDMKYYEISADAYFKNKKG